DEATYNAPQATTISYTTDTSDSTRLAGINPNGSDPIKGTITHPDDLGQEALSHDSHPTDQEFSDSDTESSSSGSYSKQVTDITDKTDSDDGIESTQDKSKEIDSSESEGTTPTPIAA